MFFPYSLDGILPFNSRPVMTTPYIDFSYLLGSEWHLPQYTHKFEEIK